MGFNSGFKGLKPLRGRNAGTQDLKEISLAVSEMKLTGKTEIGGLILFSPL